MSRLTTYVFPLKPLPRSTDDRESDFFVAQNPFHRETDFFIYTAKPQNYRKGGMPCILPMAIIGLLKVSCEEHPAQTTMTAARTAHTRSAEAAAGTDRTARIGTVSLPSVPLLPAA